jgi:hypothetical protein
MYPIYVSPFQESGIMARGRIRNAIIPAGSEFSDDESGR